MDWVAIAFRGRGRPRHIHSFLLCPEAFFVVLTDSLQFGFGWFGCLPEFVGYSQFPVSVPENVVKFNVRMNGSKKSLTIFAETQHSFGGDRCRRSAARQSHTLAPACTVTVSRAGQKRNSLGQAFFLVLKQNYKAMRK